MDGEPLIIVNADFEEKDVGAIYEKKLLIASLMLGHSKYHTLAPRVLAQGVNPRRQSLAEKKARDDRASTLEAICRRMVSFDGEFIDFFVLAPGLGNLGAILDELQMMNAWPLRATLRVSMYSGSYNMRG